MLVFVNYFSVPEIPLKDPCEPNSADVCADKKAECDSDQEICDCEENYYADRNNKCSKWILIGARLDRYVIFYVKWKIVFEINEIKWKY